MRCICPHPRFWLYGAAAIAVAGTLVLIWLVMNHTPTIQQEYDKIKIGMTEEQVRAVLGNRYEGVVPLSYQDVHVDEDRALLVKTMPHTVSYWRSGSYLITVIFDSKKKVVGKSLSRDSKG